MRCLAIPLVWRAATFYLNFQLYGLWVKYSLPVSRSTPLQPHIYTKMNVKNVRSSWLCANILQGCLHLQSSQHWPFCNMCYTRGKHGKHVKHQRTWKKHELCLQIKWFVVIFLVWKTLKDTDLGSALLNKVFTFIWPYICQNRSGHNCWCSLCGNISYVWIAWHRHLLFTID